MTPPPLGEVRHVAPLGARIGELVGQLGEVALLTARTAIALTKRPYEIRAILYQMEALGVQSTGIVATTSIFIGMVMTIQFAFGLQRFWWNRVHPAGHRPLVSS